MPLISAQTREKEIQLGSLQAKYEQEIAGQSFHNSLFTDTLYQIVENTLPQPLQNIEGQGAQHPILNFYQQNINMANAQVKVQKSRLLPQIQAGARWQSINGISPFVGYQVGINIPLFRGPYRSSIESAKIGVKAMEAELEYQEKALSNQQQLILQKLSRNYDAFSYLRDELLSLAETQTELSREAYRQGEISYLQYLQSLDQSVQVRLRFLTSLRQWHMLYADWMYWKSS